MSAKTVTLLLLLYEITFTSSSPSFQGLLEPRRVLGGSGISNGVGEAMLNKLGTMQPKTTELPSVVSPTVNAVQKYASELLPTALTSFANNNESSGMNSFSNATDNTVLWR
ncbi:DNA polymerase III subunit delta' [Anopheles sinensis]|uniref:DNA polymerase III subunit delta n=1 Tax=Anopheles sinensis TaxID=74873 RepID=A0A084VCF4_ANOSI|nr:DNA polymerase III subunit delta' [Anopheles sinensis]